MEGILSNLASKTQKRLIDVNIKVTSVSALKLVADFLKISSDT